MENKTLLINEPVVAEAKLADSCKDYQKIFDQVYQENYSFLVRIVARITIDVDIAEELCQEALLKYYQKIVFLPQGNEARYWLIRVVKNLAFNYAKRKQRERKAYNNYLNNNHQTSSNKGEKQILNDESAEIVRKAVLQLPEKLRNTIVLKEYGELDYTEISRILDITIDNVKVRISRARRKLALLIEKETVYVP